MSNEPPICKTKNEALERVRNSLKIISGRCWPECEPHVQNSIAILNGLIDQPTPDSSLADLAGLLEPIADQDWHGKWRIQKAIAIVRQHQAGHVQSLDTSAERVQNEAENEHLGSESSAMQNTPATGALEPEAGVFGSEISLADVESLRRSLRDIAPTLLANYMSPNWTEGFVEAVMVTIRPYLRTTESDNKILLQDGQCPLCKTKLEPVMSKDYPWPRPQDEDDSPPNRLSGKKSAESGRFLLLFGIFELRLSDIGVGL